MTDQYDINLSNGSVLATLRALEVNGPDNRSTPRQIQGVTAGGGGSGSFVLNGDLTFRFVTGFTFDVENSGSKIGSPPAPFGSPLSSNDGTYTVAAPGATFAAGQTTIPVDQVVSTNGLPFGQIVYTIDDTRSSLSLPGRGTLNYGELIVENLVRMTENFAADDSPDTNSFIGTNPAAQPLTGQIWYKTLSGDEGFRFWDGSNWSQLVGGDAAIIFNDIENPNAVGSPPQARIYVTGSETNLPAPWPGGSPNNEPGLVIWPEIDPPDNEPIFRVLSSDGTERLRIEHHNPINDAFIRTVNKVEVGGELRAGDDLDLTINAGTNTTTGNGRSITLNATDGGTSGDPGNIDLNAGNSNSGSYSGGNVTLRGGTYGTAQGAYFSAQGGQDDSDGGNIFARGGYSNSGDGGIAFLLGGNAGGPYDGGRVEVKGGTASGGAGGRVDVLGGVGSSGFNGGTVNVTGGVGGGSGNGGNLNLYSGAGTATAGSNPGNVTIKAADSNTALALGGDISITGGNGGDTAAGGYVNIIAGYGGSTSGDGGNLFLQSGGAPTSGNGGYINITAGNGAGAGAGGALDLNAGDGAGAGDGGAVDITSGFGGVTGAGGNINILARAGTSGGKVLVQGGLGSATGPGGDVEIEVLSNANGDPGNIILQGGSGTTGAPGSDITLSSGGGSTVNSTAGRIRLLGGTGGNTGGDGGEIELLAGSSQIGGDANGGPLTFTAGDGDGTGSGGDITLTPGSAGAGSPSGSDGAVVITPTTPPTITTDKLYNDGGTLFWNGIDITASGGTPGGADTQIQFNNAGSFDGDANLTWDGLTLTIVGGGGGSPFGTALDVTGDIVVNSQVRVSDGSATTPSFSFSNNSDSGIYRRTGPEGVSIAVDGTEQVRILSNQLSVLSGGVDAFAINGSTGVLGRGNGDLILIGGAASYQSARSFLRLSNGGGLDLRSGDDLAAGGYAAPLKIRGGAGHAGGSAGGEIEITAGDGTTTYAGGDVVITPGSGGGVGSPLPSDGAIVITQTNAPTVTTDKLYNDGGSLFWSGTNLTAQASGAIKEIQFSDGAGGFSSSSKFTFDTTATTMFIGDASSAGVIEGTTESTAAKATSTFIRGSENTLGSGSGGDLVLEGGDGDGVLGGGDILLSPGTGTTDDGFVSIVPKTGGAAIELRFREDTASGTKYVGFKAPADMDAATTGDGVSTVWTLPEGEGGEGEFMTTDGAGILKWTGGAATVVGKVITSGSPATTDTAAGIAVPPGAVLTFTVHAHGFEPATGDVHSEVIHGTIKNVAGTTSIVGTNTVAHTSSDAGAATWTVAAVADDTVDALEVDVTGEAGKTVEWTVRIDVARGF